VAAYFSAAPPGVSLAASIRTASSTVQQLTLERAGTVFLLLITLAVLVVVGVSAILTVAADDLYASIDEARGTVPQTERTQPGTWLSTRFSADLASDDLVARRERADQLNYRSERAREAASVVALAGLLVALLTARPGTAETGDRVRRLDASSPAANTISNGTV
jgi:hypothetical protein